MPSTQVTYGPEGPLVTPDRAIVGARGHAMRASLSLASCTASAGLTEPASRRSRVSATRGSPAPASTAASTRSGTPKLTLEAHGSSTATLACGPGRPRSQHRSAAILHGAASEPSAHPIEVDRTRRGIAHLGQDRRPPVRADRAHASCEASSGDAARAHDHRSSSARADEATVKRATAAGTVQQGRSSERAAERTSIDSRQPSRTRSPLERRGSANFVYRRGGAATGAPRSNQRLIDIRRMRAPSFPTCAGRSCA